MKQYKLKQFALISFLILMLCIGLTTQAVAADYHIRVNGSDLNADVKIVDGRSMIPLRAVGEALGLQVDWDGDSQQVSLTIPQGSVVLNAGNGQYRANLQSTEQYSLSLQGYVMQVPPVNIDGRLYVPVRLICDSFGAPVDVTGDIISIGKAFTDTAVSKDKVLKLLQKSGAVTGNGTAAPSSSTFEVDYLDVGQADAALVRCDGHYMLIDGGNAADSQFIYSYLKTNGIGYLDYIVCTHAHEDHVGGLAGALNYAKVGTAYAPVTDYDSRAFQSFVKYVQQQGKSISIPKAGTSFNLGSAKVTVLGPIRSSDEPNNTSIVLRIVYGNTSFLFTGDAESEEEQTILASGANLDSTVLKVGHHGSDTSTGYQWLREIMPKYAVISVGTGNTYGHPTAATLSKLRDAGVTVYRTDMQGTIVAKSDGNQVQMKPERNASANVLAGAGAGSLATSTQTPTISQKPATPTTSNITTGSKTIAAKSQYVLNNNTHKFHYPTCGSVSKMSEKNKVFFNGTRDELIQKGYSPCGNCHP